MKWRMYRKYGSLLTVTGLVMLIIYTIIATYWSRDPFTFSRLYLDPRRFIIIGYLPLGLILTCSGLIIRGRFSERNQFLAKDGEPIHSGKPWYKGSESGLYLTSCGLLVSTNQESRATAHAGYRIVPTKHATHRECVVNEGSEVLDKYAHGRAY